MIILNNILIIIRINHVNNNDYNPDIPLATNPPIHKDKRHKKRHTIKITMEQIMHVVHLRRSKSIDSDQLQFLPSCHRRPQYREHRVMEIS